MPVQLYISSAGTWSEIPTGGAGGTLPEVPYNFVVTKTSVTTNTLTWEAPDNLNGADAYEIRYSAVEYPTGPAIGTVVGTTSTSTLTINHNLTGAETPDATHYYAIASVISSTATYGNWNTAIIRPLGPLNPPTNLVATWTDIDINTLTWDAPANLNGADTYEIRYSPDGPIVTATDGVLINSVPIFNLTATHTKTDADKAPVFYYGVVAKRSSDFAYSTAAAASVDAPFFLQIPDWGPPPDFGANNPLLTWIRADSPTDLVGTLPANLTTILGTDIQNHGTSTTLTVADTVFINTPAFSTNPLLFWLVVDETDPAMVNVPVTTVIFGPQPGLMTYVGDPVAYYAGYSGLSGFNDPDMIFLAYPYTDFTLHLEWFDWLMIAGSIYGELVTLTPADGNLLSYILRQTAYDSATKTMYYDVSFCGLSYDTLGARTPAYATEIDAVLASQVLMYKGILDDTMLAELVTWANTKAPGLCGKTGLVVVPAGAAGSTWITFTWAGNQKASVYINDVLLVGNVDSGWTYDAATLTTWTRFTFDTPYERGFCYVTPDTTPLLSSEKSDLPFSVALEDIRGMAADLLMKKSARNGVPLPSPSEIPNPKCDHPTAEEYELGWQLAEKIFNQVSEIVPERDSAKLDKYTVQVRLLLDRFARYFN
jgi:hypothetical protein